MMKRALSCLLLVMGAVTTVHAARPLALGTLGKWPADVLFVCGVASLDGLAADLDALATSAGVAPLGAALRPLLVQTLGLGDVDPASIDGSRPVTMALLDPKKHALPLVAVVPLRDGSRLLVNGPRGTLPDAAAVKTLAALGAWTPRTPLALEAALATASESYAAEVAALRALLRGAMVDELSDPAARDEAQRAIDATSSMIEALAGTERLSLALDLAGGGVRLAAAATPRKGTPLAKTTKDLAARKVGNAGFVPDDAWAAMGWNLPVQTLSDDPDHVAETLLAAFGQALGNDGWSPEDIAALHEGVRRLTSAQSGSAIVWAKSSADGPVIVESLSDVKDGRAYVANLVTLGDLVFRNTMRGLQEKLALPPMSFKELVAFASSVFAPSLGMAVSVDEGWTRNGSHILGMTVAVSWDKVPGVDPRARVMAQHFVGSSMQLALAGEGKWLAAVLGPGASASASTLLASAPQRSKQKPADPILAELATGAGYLIIRPQALLHALVGAPPRGPEQPISARTASDGKRITVTLEVPPSALGILRSLP